MIVNIALDNAVMIHTVTGKMPAAAADLPAKIDIFIDLEAAKRWVTGSG